jgi:hypothetical protein
MRVEEKEGGEKRERSMKKKNGRVPYMADGFERTVYV